MVMLRHVFKNTFFHSGIDEINVLVSVPALILKSLINLEGNYCADKLANSSFFISLIGLTLYLTSY